MSFRVEIKRSVQTPKEKYDEEQERISCKEYRAPEIHPYDAARQQMTPIVFMNFILNNYGRLYLHNGQEYLDGKQATPSNKHAAADAILKRMKLEPIDLRRR